MNATVDLLQSVLPATVGVMSKVPESHRSAPILGTERMGSGTIIDDNMILTANYVAVGAEQMEVTLVDESVREAELIAHDFYSGLAVLHIAGPRLPNLRLRSSDELKSGQDVFIAASVGGAERRVNTGGITALQPFDAFWEFRLERAITTTIMNPGLGGGGLFTMDRTFCGIVALDLNEVGHFTLAIPTECFSEHREELLRDGRRTTRAARAWIGIYCYKLGRHVLVAGVLPSGPAEQAGLRAGDLILEVEGNAVHDRGNLYETIWRRPPGDEIVISIYREDAVREIRVSSGDAEVYFR